MDATLPDDRAITVPVPTVHLTVEDRFRDVKISSISHAVVQLSDNRLNSIMQSCANLTYDFDKPWPFWFFIGKTLSKAFFGEEQHLQWLNSVRVGNREFIAFTNVRNEAVLDRGHVDYVDEGIRVVEVDFSKPVPGEGLKVFWKPAREIICQRVREWLEHSRRDIPE